MSQESISHAVNLSVIHATFSQSGLFIPTLIPLFCGLQCIAESTSVVEDAWRWGLAQDLKSEKEIQTEDCRQRVRSEKARDAGSWRSFVSCLLDYLNVQNKAESNVSHSFFSPPHFSARCRPWNLNCPPHLRI